MLEFITSKYAWDTKHKEKHGLQSSSVYSRWQTTTGSWTHFPEVCPKVGSTAVFCILEHPITEQDWNILFVNWMAWYLNKEVPRFSLHSLTKMTDVQSKLHIENRQLTPLLYLGLLYHQEPYVVLYCCVPPQTDFYTTQEEYCTLLQEMGQLLGAMHDFQSLPKMPFASGLSATSV